MQLYIEFKPMFADTQRPRGSNEADGYRSRLSAPTSVSNAFSQRTSMDYDHGRLLEAPRRPLQAPQTFAPAPGESCHLRRILSCCRSFLSERTLLERCCVHNMSPFVSSSGLSPGSREV